MKIYFLLLVLLFCFTDCKNDKSDTYTDVTSVYSKISDPTHPGKKLMETYCYACHDATTTEDKRLAPPMIAIKNRYIFKSTTKAEFTDAMQNWIKNPNEKDAKMFGAVKRFGVMAKLPYPEDVISKISDYIYDNDIEQPEWFQEHYNQKRGKGMY
ncbi:c-type cytochrome [Mariniflexile sp.]|uniref:c-type cytochrome n=1 Tax=Mariniflexile sp. TaxID=1979402 RepID=UPI00356889F6